MVLGIIGIARASIENSIQQHVSQAVGQSAQSLPLAPLVAAFLFVGGLMILAKRQTSLSFDNDNTPAERTSKISQLVVPGPRV